FCPELLAVAQVFWNFAVRREVTLRRLSAPLYQLFPKMAKSLVDLHLFDFSVFRDRLKNVEMIGRKPADSKNPAPQVLHSSMIQGVEVATDIELDYAAVAKFSNCNDSVPGKMNIALASLTVAYGDAPVCKDTR